MVLKRSLTGLQAFSCKIDLLLGNCKQQAIQVYTYMYFMCFIYSSMHFQVKGIKGASILFLHKPFNGVKGVGIDSLHIIKFFVGVVSDLLKYWFDKQHRKSAYSIFSKVR